MRFFSNMLRENEIVNTDQRLRKPLNERERE